MGKNEAKIAEKVLVHTTTEIFSDLLSTITSNDLRKYIKVKRDKQRIMRDITLSKLFFLFERENLLNAITHQVHLSETIELIVGTIVSDDLRQFRGLLLNIERASIYFYIFYWIFRFLNNFKASRIALGSYNSFQFLFEQIWEIQYPWDLIRPEGIFDPITLTQIPEIQKIVNTLQKNAWKIANTIEKGKTVKNILEEVENLSLDMVKRTGITGPMVRTLGTVTSQITPSTPSTRQSAQIFLKHTYTTESNLLNVLRVSYTELILSLNQFSHLLKGYTIMPQGTLNSLDGEATTSFTTTLGESHLTLNILEDQVKYFNFIPPQMANITGIVESLSTCPSSLQSIILLLFDPEFLLYLE
jgi:Ni,Fe-hydrogenase III large subunit